jgi:large subunit ribosomal protein L30
MAQKSSTSKAKSTTAVKKTAIKRKPATEPKSTTKTSPKPVSKATPKKKNVQTSREKRFAVIRVRGINNVRKDISDTISLMNLRRINNLSFIDDRVDYKGMLQKSKDFITWGEPSIEVITDLLKKWGRVLGDKPLTDKFVAEHSKFKTINEFAKNFVDLKAEISDIATLKPFFRLHPPKGGHKGKGIKYAYKANGALGYRGSAINDLIKLMAGL